MPHEAPIEEAGRIMTICNACRYCEGYCAVFPAMERRLSFLPGDLKYLANLCHGCGECYYACQYAPPHEFAVNVPRTLAQVRVESYRQYAWPPAVGVAFERSGVVAALAVALGLSGILALSIAIVGDARLLATPVPGGDFYRIIPHGVMAATFGGVALLVLVALGMGLARFWRDAGESGAQLGHGFAWRDALTDVFSLKYLHGGGMGCTYPDEHRSQARRWFHHLTFYGFLLCFAATCTATVYHYLLRLEAPYPYLSLPVGLGTLGGIGLLIGPLGLLWLRAHRDPQTAEPSQTLLDAGFAVLLSLTSASGLLLTVLRESSMLGLLLVIHLGLVMALFLTMPYGKFVHGMYRAAALLKYALERARPVTHRAGND